MSCRNDTIITAVLWYLNGCMVSFYQQSNENDDRKRPLETLNLPYPNLSYKQINILKITQPAVNRLSYLSTLNLQNNRLTTLPPELWQLTGLQELNIGKNQITHIPDDIGYLVNLRELYAYDNAIQEVPSQLGRLTVLRVLDLTSNRLRWLPAEVLRMKLINLWIDKNKVLIKEEQPPVSWKQLAAGLYMMPSSPSSSSFDEIMSLRSTCIQIIGQAILDDPDQLTALQDSCLTQIMLEQLSIDPGCALLCTICQNVIFHGGLCLIYFDKFIFEQSTMTKIPFLYRTCSQTCWNIIKLSRMRGDLSTLKYRMDP
ncbi:hypothetical protein BDB00DRAFT_813460 [Zychaea mexicana]|uniref:uncharacterized protein n=1 Tax=Zychaea mexicana TaxID=64656 RepID=UPI0022FDEC65|nr:uncharacterized protein BDB00DRAFT_813460 [Zychaea mexicana]KAI9495467.1 hypothetical protein BDB00DRAFT_813460 [Zychaea mexicana]